VEREREREGTQSENGKNKCANVNFLRVYRKDQEYIPIEYTGRRFSIDCEGKVRRMHVLFSAFF
jgi:hypothetical protein